MIYNDNDLIVYKHIYSSDTCVYF